MRNYTTLTLELRSSSLRSYSFSPPPPFTPVCFRASYYKETGQRMCGTDAKYVLACLRHLPRSVQDFMVSGHPFAPFYVGGNVEE